MAYTVPTDLSTGDTVTAAIWNTDIEGNTLWFAGTHDHSGDTGDGGNIRHSMWVQPHYSVGANDVLATVYGATLYSGTETADAETDDIYWTIAIPTGFNTLQKAVVVALTAGTGNIYRSVTTAFAASGEAHNTHSDAIAIAAVAAVANQMLEDDISAAFTGIAAGDYVGVMWERQAGHASDTIGTTVTVLGLLLEWT